MSAHKIEIPGIIQKIEYNILMFFVLYPSKHLPEDGHNRWPIHVGGLHCLWCINSHIYIYICWLYSQNYCNKILQVL